MPFFSPCTKNLTLAKISYKKRGAVFFDIQQQDYQREIQVINKKTTAVTECQKKCTFRH
jgi:hypothetical protein